MESDWSGGCWDRGRFPVRSARSGRGSHSPGRGDHGGDLVNLGSGDRVGRRRFADRRRPVRPVCGRRTVGLAYRLVRVDLDPVACVGRSPAVETRHALAIVVPVVVGSFAVPSRAPGRQGTRDPFGRLGCWESGGSSGLGRSGRRTPAERRARRRPIGRAGGSRSARCAGRLRERSAGGFGAPSPLGRGSVHALVAVTTEPGRLSGLPCHVEFGRRPASPPGFGGPRAASAPNTIHRDDRRRWRYPVTGGLQPGSRRALPAGGPLLRWESGHRCGGAQIARHRADPSGEVPSRRASSRGQLRGAHIRSAPRDGSGGPAGVEAPGR